MQKFRRQLSLNNFQILIDSDDDFCYNGFCRLNSSNQNQVANFAKICRAVAQSQFGYFVDSVNQIIALDIFDARPRNVAVPIFSDIFRGCAAANEIANFTQRRQPPIIWQAGVFF